MCLTQLLGVQAGTGEAPPPVTMSPMQTSPSFLYSGRKWSHGGHLYLCQRSRRLWRQVAPRAGHRQRSVPERRLVVVQTLQSAGSAACNHCRTRQHFDPMMLL